MAVPVALRRALGAGLAPFSADDNVRVGGQQRVDHGLQQLAHQIRRRVGEGFTEQAGRVDNMRCGHRDDAFRVGCESFLEGSHGDRAHAHDEAGHRGLHHSKGHYSGVMPQFERSDSVEEILRGSCCHGASVQIEDVDDAGQEGSGAPCRRASRASRQGTVR